MATFQSFVTEYYLKSFTPISQNVDITEVTPHLETVELINTRELIGKPLYDDLKTKFINQTLDANEIQLVDLLKRGISYRATAECIPFLSMKITSKGVQTLRGDYSETPGLNSIKYLKAELENKAEYYEQRVIEYLCKNSKYFPLYNTSDDIEGIIQSSETRYDSDIYIDDMDNLRLNKYLYGPNKNS